MLQDGFQGDEMNWLQERNIGIVKDPVLNYRQLTSCLSIYELRQYNGSETTHSSLRGTGDALFGTSDNVSMRGYVLYPLTVTS